jgi:hypothetical protein
MDSGALVEKQVLARAVIESVWMGWNEQTAGLASAWWRDEILANSAIAAIYLRKRREISQLKECRCVAKYCLLYPMWGKICGLKPNE